MRHKKLLPSRRTWLRWVQGCALMLALGCLGLVVRAQRQIGITGAPTTNAQKRIALVIGNGAYRTIGPLKNPANDARAMATTLQGLGFDVTSATDTDQRTMKRLIREFGEKLRQTGGAGLFYYAGHGVQLNNKNYLIPVEIDVAGEADVKDQAVDVQYVLDWMNDAQNGLNIIILDACRNNPFTRSVRSAGDGLAQVDAPTGTLIAYATAPGRVAADGEGDNGLYTAELLKQMRVPGLSEADLFKNVRAGVLKQTKGTKREQVPWEVSSLVGTFYFNPLAVAVPKPTPLPITPANEGPEPVIVRRDLPAREREAWLLVRNSTDAEDFREFLAAYPNGANAGNAGIKLEQLVWDAARNNGSKAALDAYLKEFPTGDNVATARLMLSRLARASQPPPVVPTNSPVTPATTRRVTGQVESVALPQGVSLSMVYLGPGQFKMGSNKYDDEKPVHEVTISRGFYLGQYEVTQGQWKALMGKLPEGMGDLEAKFNGDKLPVVRVSWDEVQDFIKRLNQQTGEQYRLPTEAEWEYAARAGSEGDYGNVGGREGSLAELGRYEGNSDNRPHEVGTKRANDWGLYDMQGNVWEWVADWYSNSYGSSSAVTDPRGARTGSYRVYRGGSWNLTAVSARAAYRGSLAPGDRVNFVGFRLARTPI